MQLTIRSAVDFGLYCFGRLIVIRDSGFFIDIFDFLFHVSDATDRDIEID